MSLINKTTLPWYIYFGIPAKPQKKRIKDLLNIEIDFLKEYKIKSQKNMKKNNKCNSFINAKL